MSGPQSMQIQTLGERIKFAVEKAGLTVAQVCDELGVGRSAFSQWASDVTNPSITNLKKLATLTNTAPEWLAFGITATVPSEEQTVKEIVREVRVPADTAPGMLSVPELTLEEGRIVTSRTWVLPDALIEYHLRARPDKAALTEISEDSLGGLQEYDYAIIDRSQYIPKRPGLSVLNRGFYMSVRHLIPLDAIGASIKMRGLDGFEEMLDLDAMEIIGRVVGTVKRQTTSLSASSFINNKIDA